jgi:hypothetical protein
MEMATVIKMVPAMAMCDMGCTTYGKMYVYMSVDTMNALGLIL